VAWIPQLAGRDEYNQVMLETVAEAVRQIGPSSGRGS